MPDYATPTRQALKKIGSAISNTYGDVKRNRQVKAIAEAQKGVEAAEKGLFSSAKYKTLKTARRVGGVLNVAFVGKSLYDIAMAGKEHGLKEAGKVALRETVTTAPYFIPYVGLGLGVTDVARMIRGEKGVAETALDELYAYSPSLRPIDSEESEPTESYDRPVESVETQQPMSQPSQINMPSEAEIRQLQRRNQAKVNAYQEGKRLIEEWPR